MKTQQQMHLSALGLQCSFYLSCSCVFSWGSDNLVADYHKIDLIHLFEYSKTGAHFNPNNLTCGVLEDESCHADDLGNLNANEASIVDNQIPLSGPNAVNGRAFVVDELDDNLGEVAAVPKKRTSKSKTRIRKNYWKRKGYQAALKALSLAKSLYSGKSKSFMTDKLKE